MTFDQLLECWNEASAAAAAYRLSHRSCACQGMRRRASVEFTARQLDASADHWLGELHAELLRMRQELPLI